jgi:hypothetical protein
MIFLSRENVVYVIVVYITVARDAESVSTAIRTTNTIIRGLPYDC